jgi:iron complex outermembrane receptor protein
LKFHFDHSYTSKRRANQAIIDTDASLRPLVNFGLLKNYRGSQEFTDLRLTWLDPSERYSISAFVQNLGDNQYVSEINTITTPSFGTPYTRLSNPRFFGVDLGVKW